MYSMNWFTRFLVITLFCLPMSVATATEHLSPELEPERGGDFTLLSNNGAVSLEQFRGKIVLLFFGFTSCPDICPIALSVISRVLNQLTAEERDQVNALFVSLDPGRDTPELLQKYSAYFHPNIIGVTDRLERINQVTGKYGIVFEKKAMSSSPIGYVISHSPDILVVNRKGQLLKSRISPEHSVDEITAFVRMLLRD